MLKLDFTPSTPITPLRTFWAHCSRSRDKLLEHADVTLVSTAAQLAPWLGSSKILQLLFINLDVYT